MLYYFIIFLTDRNGGGDISTIQKFKNKDHPNIFILMLF